MQIDVANPQLQTAIFAAMFFIALLASMRPAERDEAFPPTLTSELKGFAILTVIFGHIGFGLAKDNAFLQPLSILAGVGVNIFLFLSGLGLTLSFEKTPLAPAPFYRRRFVPILVPLWITLTVLYAADFLFLHLSYPPASILGSYAGFFPSAKLFTDLNSPLWYLTFLFSYYLFFPFLYRKGRPIVSALSVLAVSIALIVASRPFVGSTLWLYVIHCNAFPLGMLAAHALKRLPKKPLTKLVPAAPRLVAMLALGFLATYTAMHAGIGRWYEQPLSIVTTLSVIALFALGSRRFPLFDLFGKFSYEIYLFHWPLLYRYGFMYARLPAWLATALYLALFLVLGLTLHAASHVFSGKRHHPAEPAQS